jgi:Na+/H+ antiporter NhaD/arsenite permease-like protein
MVSASAKNGFQGPSLAWDNSGMRSCYTAMRQSNPIVLIPLSGAILFPAASFASHMEGSGGNLTSHWVGYLSLAIFTGALLLVVIEEFTALHKSKPVIVAAGVIWALIAWTLAQQGDTASAEIAVRHNLLQYVELMLLMLVVMTYINAMNERQVFAALRSFLTRRGFDYSRLFWITGFGTFLLSPFLDNLSTALLAGAIVLAAGAGNGRFIAPACINVVVAANAGGAFSPFGDITTLMVWQANIHTSTGTVDFGSFFNLVIPSLVSYLIPATALHFALPRGKIQQAVEEQVPMRRGARRIILLFVASIATAVLFRSLLDLPAVIGMLTGLSYLQFFGFYLKKSHRKGEIGVGDEERLGGPIPLDSDTPFDIFHRISRVEWDTLLFLYGVALSVGGLGFLGYLSITSHLLYTHLGATTANISVGLASAVLENIPTMYAVLTMMPEMSRDQWLLVTLTTGIGGSILSIGSAAGIALMGQARGHYTFFTHLKWTPVILLGYGGGVLTFILMRGGAS